MQVFYLSDCPEECAQQLCDKHVVKMCLETAQILCAVHHINNSRGAPYRLTHYKHPCVQWAQQSYQNYYWLVNHGKYLCAEYTHRFGKRHKSQDVIEWCEERVPLSVIDRSQGFIEPPQVVPDEYKLEDEPCEAYIQYYQSKLDNGMDMRYTSRKRPIWLRG